MERIRKYIGRPVMLEHIKDAAALEQWGMTCRYLPDPPEDFDEFEFSADLAGIENLALMVTVEAMTVKRVFFGILSPEDPDIVTGLDDAQIEKIFDQSGDALFQFFDYITQ